MKLLAIESSCDETAAAVIEDGHRILSSVVASQVNDHARYGGVVPELASRQHLRHIQPVIEAALAESGVALDELDAVTGTRGPGLAGSLLVGYNAAKAIAYGCGLPFLGANHLEGHVYANWLTEGPPPRFPALCLVVSGGHTDLVLMREHGSFERIGGTRDDAAGEAFDKVARLLGLPYPGGPPISRAAAGATVRKLRLPRAWLGESDDFSFSGLKTAVLTIVQSEGAPPAAEIAWAFEESVVDVLSKKAARAAECEGVASLLVAGGVAANRRLRERVVERATVPVHVPPIALCTDNAAMIAAAAFRHLDDAVAPESALDIIPTAVRRGRRWA